MSLLFLTQEGERVCTDNLILKQTELQTYTNLPCLKLLTLCSKLPRNLYRFLPSVPLEGDYFAVEPSSLAEGNDTNKDR